MVVPRRLTAWAVLTGTDILMDGGVTASYRFGPLNPDRRTA